MNSKKIVSIIAAASMLASMAVNASAFTYTAPTTETVGDKDVTTTTWNFQDKGQGVTLTAENYKEELHGLNFVLSSGNDAKFSDMSFETREGNSDEGTVQLNYGGSRIVSVTPDTDGTLNVTTNAAATFEYIYIGTELGQTVGIATGNTASLAVTAGTTYYIYNAIPASVAKTSIKLRSVTLVSEADHVAAPANLTVSEVKNKGAITDIKEVSDAKKGTAFVATIKNDGESDGTIESINWIITSKGESKTTGDLAADFAPISTLEAGASITVALYVEGLGDKSATATAEVK